MTDQQQTLVEELCAALEQAVKIIREHVPIEALGIDTDTPGASGGEPYREWPILEEHLYYMDRALTRAREETGSNPWHSIETVPDKGLVDVWIKDNDGTGKRWCDCYYDHITDQWRTSRPGGKLVRVPARAVTHWMRAPEGPDTRAREEAGGGE